MKENFKIHLVFAAQWQNWPYISLPQNCWPSCDNDWYADEKEFCIIQIMSCANCHISPFRILDYHISKYYHSLPNPSVEKTFRMHSVWSGRVYNCIALKHLLWRGHLALMSCPSGCIQMRSLSTQTNVKKWVKPAQCSSRFFWHSCNQCAHLLMSTLTF